MAAKRYWLMKTEPGCFSVDDLAALPKRTTSWDGVRNYQARNLLRDEIKAGDRVLFYHSGGKPTGIAGICTVVKAGYPDHTARDPEGEHFDPKSTKDNPIWYMVDVQLAEKLPEVLPLSQLKQTSGLERMMVCQRGAMLSVQPVRPDEWKIISKLIKSLRTT